MHSKRLDIVALRIAQILIALDFGTNANTAIESLNNYVDTLKCVKISLLFSTNKFHYRDFDMCHGNMLEWFASHCIHSYVRHLLPCILPLCKLPTNCWLTLQIEHLQHLCIHHQIKVYFNKICILKYRNEVCIHFTLNSSMYSKTQCRQTCNAQF